MNTITWRASYIDGSVLEENEGNAKHSYLDIDQSKLRFFDLIDNGRILLRCYFSGKPQKNLIFRRRHIQVYGTSREIVVIICGWQMKVAGRSQQSLVVVQEDGTMTFLDKWQPTIETSEILPIGKAPEPLQDRGERWVIE